MECRQQIIGDMKRLSPRTFPIVKTKILEIITTLVMLFITCYNIYFGVYSRLA